MNSKEIKQLHTLFKKNWGFNSKLEFTFLKTDKEKVYGINKEICKIDFMKLKIDSLGLYMGELKKGQLRLSIEGSQLIGPYSDKNIIKLDKDELKEWLKGEEIPVNFEEENFVIIKHEKDYFGSGKLKNGKILNYVPKTRRLNFIETEE